MEKRFQRRRFLIEPVFQYRFVKKVTALALLAVTSSTIGVMVVLSVLKRQISQPDPFSDRASVSLQSMPDVSWMMTHLWPYFLLGMFFVAVVSALFGFMESFRVAGPAYRMRQLLASMTKGDFSGPIVQLRKRDELEKLYRAILDNHQQWRSHVINMQRICASDVDNDNKVKQLEDVVESFRVGEVR